MSLEAIFASKMFKASPNQDKIRAQIENPINTELVQQLRTYLDDEYIKPEYLDPESFKVSKGPEGTDAGHPLGEEPGEPGPAGPIHSGGGHAPSMGGGFSGGEDGFIEEGTEGDNPDDGEPLEDGEGEFTEGPNDGIIVEGEPLEEPPEGGPDEAVAESHDPNMQEVSGVEEPVLDNALEDLDGLKSSLNSNDDTSGVCRIQVKNDELWIYYSDDTNLNTTMEPVIQFFLSSGYTYLEFNRLARTQNAIVFTINSSNIPEA